MNAVTGGIAVRAGILAYDDVASDSVGQIHTHVCVCKYVQKHASIVIVGKKASIRDECVPLVPGRILGQDAKEGLIMVASKVCTSVST